MYNGVYIPTPSIGLSFDQDKIETSNSSFMQFLKDLNVTKKLLPLYYKYGEDTLEKPDFLPNSSYLISKITTAPEFATGADFNVILQNLPNLFSDFISGDESFLEILSADTISFTPQSAFEFLAKFVAYRRFIYLTNNALLGTGTHNQRIDVWEDNVDDFSGVKADDKLAIRAFLTAQKRLHVFMTAVSNPGAIDLSLFGTEEQTQLSNIMANMPQVLTLANNYVNSLGAGTFKDACNDLLSEFQSPNFYNDFNSTFWSYYDLTNPILDPAANNIDDKYAWFMNLPSGTSSNDNWAANVKSDLDSWSNWIDTEIAANMALNNSLELQHEERMEAEEKEEKEKLEKEIDDKLENARYEAKLRQRRAEMKKYDEKISSKKKAESKRLNQKLLAKLAARRKQLMKVKPKPKAVNRAASSNNQNRARRKK